MDETHNTFCDCVHTHCVRNKSLQLCCRWCFYRRGGPSHLREASSTLRLLRRYVEAQDSAMNFFGVRMVDGTLCFLLRFEYKGKEPGGFAARLRRGFMAMNNIDKTSSWDSLGCCAEDVDLSVKDWLGTLVRTDNVADLGDESVLISFREEIAQL